MNFELKAVSPEHFGRLAEYAHQVSFKEDRPLKMNTFDYVLVCASATDIFSYATIIEMDSETAYMQHGGAMPNIKGSVNVKRVYHETVQWLKSKYNRISTRIENKNVPMLKLAMSEGLLVNGCDLYKGEVYLHLCWGFE